MRIIIFILLTVILTNCTVQKRVHRKGWHVEWRKAHRSENTAKTEKQDEKSILVSKDKYNSAKTTKRNTSEIQSNLKDTNETHLAELPDKSPNEATGLIERFGGDDLDVSTGTVEEKNSNNLSEKKIQEQKRIVHARNSGNSGATLLVTGVILLLLGLIAILILGLTGNLGGVIIGALLLGILGGLGLVLMLIGLVLIIIG